MAECSLDSQCPRPSPSVPIVGKPARADRARAAHLMAKRGLNDAEIALRLGTTERYVIRLKNTDVEPLPDYDFSWFGEDDEAIELVEGAAAQ
jgi:uncharacterized membrane protein